MTDEAVFSDIDQAMMNAVKEGVFPGGVLLWANRKKLFYHKGFGVADLATCVPVDPETVFDLASLTKPLATTLAVADLVKTGQLKTETCVGDILSDARGTDKDSISIDMLLRHTSGLPAHREYFKKVKRSFAEARLEIRNLVIKEPLIEKPGEKEVYSDLGYILLAWVVEYLSGMRLDKFVQERIYDPLRISRLYFGDLVQCKTAPNREGNIDIPAATSDCLWRKKLIIGEVEDENAWAAGGIEGHAGLFGDAMCVYKLCCEIMAAIDGESVVLSSDVINAFLRKKDGLERVAGFDTPSKSDSSSGSHFSNRAIGHLGFTGTSFWMDPEDGLIAILLTNRVHPSRENIKIKSFRPQIHDLISSNYNRNIRL